MAYLVAQIDDQVRLEYAAGEYGGCVGRVIGERPSRTPSVTARECLVEMWDGNSAWVHADQLTVVYEDDLD